MTYKSQKSLSAKGCVPRIDEFIEPCLAAALILWRLWGIVASGARIAR